MDDSVASEREVVKMDNGYVKEIKDFGKAVKKIRELRGMTQEDILSCTGIARSGVVDIEKGKRFPMGLNILRLCEAFRITPQQLMELAFKDWQYPVEPLTPQYAKKRKGKETDIDPARTGAPAPNCGEARAASEDQPPKRIRSTRMRVDRGGDTVYNCDESFNEKYYQSEKDLE